MEKINNIGSTNKNIIKKLDYFVDLCNAWIRELDFRTKNTQTNLEKEKNKAKVKQFRDFKRILLKIEDHILNNNTSEDFLSLVEKYDSDLELVSFIEEEQEKIEKGKSTLEFLRKRKEIREKNNKKNTENNKNIEALRENLELVDFIDKNLVDIHTSVYVGGGFITNGDLGYTDNIGYHLDKMEDSNIYELVKIEKLTEEIKIPIEKERKKFFGLKKEKYIEYEYGGKQEVKFKNLNSNYQKDDIAYKLSYIYADPDYKDHSGRKGNLLVVNVIFPEKDIQLIKNNINNLGFFRQISKLSFYKVMKKKFNLPEKEIDLLRNEGGEKNNNIPVKPKYNGNKFLKEIDL